MGITSRSSKSSPATRRWVDAKHAAYVSEKPLGEMWRVNLPPFTDVTRPNWDKRHPIDVFFSQPAEKYRVVRQEEIDGRTLTVVEVAASYDPGSPAGVFFRAWLDLARGLCR